MARRIVTVPPRLIQAEGADWWIDWGTQSAADANDGMSQTRIAAFPRWTGRPPLVMGPAAIRGWRALVWQAQGVLGVYRVTMCDAIGWGRAQAGVSEDVRTGGLPFAGGSTWTTGGWEVEPFVTAAAPAAKGAEAVRVDIGTLPAPPRQGQIMSCGDWPFGVTDIAPVAGTVYDLQVQMPLRRAIPAGALIRMRGQGLFEIADAAAANPAYGLDRQARPQVTFREWLNRV